MQNEKDPKKAAAHCFNSIQLDPENYRIGHTKASTLHNAHFVLIFLIYVGVCLWILTYRIVYRRPKGKKRQLLLDIRPECI